jgi:hypothetical protein
MRLTQDVKCFSNRAIVELNIAVIATGSKQNSCRVGKASRSPTQSLNSAIISFEFSDRLLQLK